VIEGIGSSIKNVATLVCLLKLKEYAAFIKLRNKKIEIPAIDAKTGKILGFSIKAKLSITVQKLATFEAVAKEEV
jgi:hypothetical protein